MRIAAAGGLGFEQELLRSLKGNSVSLYGSGYDLKKERFITAEGAAAFTGEYITHNYSQLLSEHDILIELSGNLKSAFLMNDIAVKYGKRFLALIDLNGWKFVSFDPKSGSGCLRCFMDYSRPLPPVTLPAVPAEKAVAEIAAALSGNDAGFVLDLMSGEKTLIAKKCNCVAESGSYPYLKGEMADIAAVSCSDHSVAITPLNDMPVNLQIYKTLLEPHVKIVKESQFFLQFKLQKLDCTIFRLGRMVVKGTKEKNTGFFIYRNYLGT